VSEQAGPIDHAPEGTDTAGQFSRGRNPRSLANLAKYGPKQGEVRNKTGRNGRTGQAEIVKFLKEPSETDKDRSKFRRIIEKMYAKAIAGDAVAARTLIEQYAGKPKQAMDLSNSDQTMRPPKLEITLFEGGDATTPIETPPK